APAPAGDRGVPLRRGRVCGRAAFPRLARSLHRGCALLDADAAQRPLPGLRGGVHARGRRRQLVRRGQGHARPARGAARHGSALGGGAALAHLPHGLERPGPARIAVHGGDAVGDRRSLPIPRLPQSGRDGDRPARRQARGHPAAGRWGLEDRAAHGRARPERLAREESDVLHIGILAAAPLGPLVTLADMGGAKIHWHIQKEVRFPFGRYAPDPDWYEPIGFPPPWPSRPWIFGVMVTSANGVVAWQRSGPGDDPVLALLGGDGKRDERIVDRRHMRHLRCFGDVAIGAQTLREQPDLIQTPQEPGEEPMEALYRFRHAHGLPVQPRHVVYSLRGCLDLTRPIYNTPGVEVILVTTAAGELDLRSCGIETKGAALLVEPRLEDAWALRRVHARLFEERGVRYLGCEGR